MCAGMCACVYACVYVCVCKPMCCRSWLFVVDPSSGLYYRWLAVVSLAVLYNLVMIIARAVYWKLQENYAALWMALDYTADFIYVIDMAVRFCTGTNTKVSLYYI